MRQVEKTGIFWLTRKAVRSPFRPMEGQEAAVAAAEKAAGAAPADRADSVARTARDGRSGSDGHDGMSGSNGLPGSAGVITIVYDPAVKPFLAAIKTSNKGAPAPVYQEAPVAPLW